MSKQIQKLLAENPVEDEERKDKPDEDKPAAEDAAPEEDKPEETPADPPAEEVEDTPADEDKPEEDEAECGDGKPKAADEISARFAAIEKRIDAYEAENARLRAMLADPAFAAAAAKPTTVPAAGDAATPALTREAANAEYAKLKTPREKAAYREAHRAELGLR